MKAHAVATCEQPRTSSLCPTDTANTTSFPSTSKHKDRTTTQKSKSSREAVTGPSQSIAEQQTLFTTLLMRQHQQEKSQARVRVTKAIKPEVQDFYDNQNDPFLMDSITSALDRSSVSAIAIEKVTSPSVMRNKHIKTMTSLGGTQTTLTGQPFAGTATKARNLDAEGEVYIGRNTTFMAGSNRLFKRQQELLHLQKQLDNPDSLSKAVKNPLPLNPLIFKTLSNLDELSQKNETRTSQKDSASTVLFTKVKHSRKDLLAKDFALLRKDSFSMEPVHKSRQQLQSAGGLTMPDQQVFPKALHQKVCSKNVVSLKKRRNNSTTEMSQISSLLTTSKPKTQLHSRLQIYSASQTGLGTVKQAQIVLESSPQQQNTCSMTQKQMNMFDQVPSQAHTGNLTAKLAKNQTPTTTNSKGAEISQAELANFSYAAKKAVKNSNRTVKESDSIVATPGTTQTTMTSLGKTQSSNQQRHTTKPSSAKNGGTSKQDRQSFFAKKGGAVASEHLLTQDVTVQGKKGHHVSKGVSKMTALGSATNVQQTRQQSFLNEDDVLPQSKAVPHSKLQQTLIKKEIPTAQNDGTSIRSNRKHQQQHGRSSLMTSKLGGKESQGNIAVKTSKVEKRIVPSSSDVSRLEQNLQSSRSPKGSLGIPMSRNFKTNYQILDEERHSHEESTRDGHPTQSQLAALLTGNLTSRSSAGASGIGSKKEIKCVITKQTKFNEERQSNQRQSQLGEAHGPAEHHLEGLDRRGSGKKATKKSNCEAEVVKSASKISTHSRGGAKCSTSAVQMPKTFTPTLAIFAPTKKEKSQQIKDQRQQQPSSAQKTQPQPVPQSASVDKKKEKMQRQFLVQKIKNQLISAFDHGRSSKDCFNKVNSSAASDLGAGKDHSRHRVILHTQEDNISSPGFKNPQLRLNTPTREPNPNKPQKAQKLTNISATKPSYNQNNLRNRYSLNLNQKSDKKSKRRRPGPENKSARFDTQLPSKLDFTVQTREDSPLNQVSKKSIYDSQTSAPREMTTSSNGGSDQSEFREPSRGVILPTSVAKATKDKLAKLDMIFKLDSKSAVKGVSRNAGQEDFRFSQKFQRTQPNLALTNDNRLVGTQTLHQNAQRVFSKDRKTYFSDTRSMDLRRSYKPKFLEKHNKNSKDVKERESLHSPWETQPISILDDSPQQPDMSELDKQVPPAGLYEDLKVKAEVRANNHRNHQASADKQSMQKVNDYDTDQGALTAKMLEVFSPPDSVANGTCASNKVNAFNLPMDSQKRSDSPNQSIEDTFTNGAFSDSQFGDIADEENYKTGDLNQEMTPMQVEMDCETQKHELIILPKQGRPDFSGRYKSCTNKHEAMQTSKRVPTVRVEVFQQTEAAVVSNHGIHLETAREILSKKGSKCKCKVKSPNGSGKEKMVCGNFCKHLSGRQQKKIVKKLMLDHFKTTINSAMQSGQKLSLAKRHNPFMHQANFGCLSDRKFLISASWWSKWCDYVNYTVDELGLTFPKDSFRDTFLCDTNEEQDDIENLFQGVEVVDVEFEDQQDKVDQILRLSIFQQSSFATLEEAIQNENEQSQLFYERPGCIENKDLLEADVTYLNQVKRTVVEHFDFEVVPQSVWQHLYSWYSADVTICRRLVMDAMHIKASQDSQLPSLSAPAMIGRPMDQQDQSRNHHHQYRVVLDLFPQLNSFGAIQDERNPTFLERRQNYLGTCGVFDEGDDPVSGDTTQMLYKKHIEDPSQTQTNLMQSPDDQVCDSYYRSSDLRNKEKNVLTKWENYENDSILFQSKVASLEPGKRISGPQNRISRKTVGVILDTDDSFSM